MKTIFIGIPTSRIYKLFWESLSIFLPKLGEKYKYEVYTVSDKLLADARNEIAKKFLESDKDYLLFLDDDHSGHTLEMFEAILEPILKNSSNMSGIRCFARGFPYPSNIQVYSKFDEKAAGLKEGQAKYIPVDLDKGYIYCDLIGFGMTLITRKAFELVGEPYFVGQDNMREDNYFCDKLVEKGIQPVGCFNYTLEHNGIGIHNALPLRNAGIATLKEKYPDMKVLVS